MQRKKGLYIFYKDITSCCDVRRRRTAVAASVTAAAAAATATATIFRAGTRFVDR